MTKILKLKFTVGAALAAAVLLTLGIASCKKTTPGTPTSTTQMGTLIFHMHTLIDTTEVDDTTLAYKNADGRLMKIRLAQMYISNIRLVKADGTIFKPDSTMLKNIPLEDYPLGPIPAGTYPTVMFDVAVDSADNHRNPSSFASTEPQAVQTPSMWFGNTTSGYIFVNLQGTVDSSAAMNGKKVNYPISYQIGLDANRKTVTLPNNIYATVLPNVPNTMHFTIDYGMLIHKLNIKTQNMVNSASNDPTNATATIAANIPNMFQYEK